MTKKKYLSIWIPILSIIMAVVLVANIAANAKEVLKLKK